MNEEHFNQSVFEVEQLPFQDLEPWQMSNCYFCFRFLESAQINERQKSSNCVL